MKSGFDDAASVHDFWARRSRTALVWKGWTSVEGRERGTLVSSNLFRPHPTEPTATLLAATSHVRLQVEQTRLELLKWIGKHWLVNRQEKGFDPLEGCAMKEISDHIEVPIEDLLTCSARLYTLLIAALGRPMFPVNVQISDVATALLYPSPHRSSAPRAYSSFVRDLRGAAGHKAGGYGGSGAPREGGGRFNDPPPPHQYDPALCSAQANATSSRTVPASSEPMHRGLDLLKTY